VGLFDGAIDSTFGHGDEGEPVFYPYGPVGRGYVITSDLETRLRAFLRNLCWLTVAGGAFAGAVLTRFGSRGVLGLGVLILLMVGFYEGCWRRLVRGARSVSRER
jgi:hypothetical protein